MIAAYHRVGLHNLRAEYCSHPWWLSYGGVGMQYFYPIPGQEFNQVLFAAINFRLIVFLELVFFFNFPNDRLPLVP